MNSNSWQNKKYAEGKSRKGGGWTEWGTRTKVWRKKRQKKMTRDGRAHDVKGKKRRSWEAGWWERQGKVENGKKWACFFVTCPLGVAVSSQSRGLICVSVRGWILSSWEASRRLQKIEVESKLDAQEDGVGGATIGCRWTPPTPHPRCSPYSLTFVRILLFVMLFSGFLTVVIQYCININTVNNPTTFCFLTIKLGLKNQNIFNLFIFNTWHKHTECWEVKCW